MSTQTIERPKVARVRHSYVDMKRIESYTRKHKSRIYDEHICRADFAKMATIELDIKVNPAHLKIATETLKIIWPRRRRNDRAVAADPRLDTIKPSLLCVDGLRALADSVAQLHESLGEAIPVPLHELRQNLDKY